MSETPLQNSKQPKPLRGYHIKNMGENRGKPRIYLEHTEVSPAGFQKGDRYDIHLKNGVFRIEANPNGARKISGKIHKTTGEEVPVIDINSEKLLALFDGMAAIRVMQREGEIFLLPLATEVKKKERLNRLRYKVQNGIPLEIGSLSHGGGLLSKAVHEGLHAAGVATRKGFVNEIRPELLDYASTSEEWAPTTAPLAAPMQELAFDDMAMRILPKQDGMEMGLPCSGASVAGRAVRGTKQAEDHPEVGHLVVAALVILAKANPAFVIFENVIPYSNSASASILRSQLRDLGYETHETVLKGEDFNALEPRNRWCMIAVTQGMHFSWDMLQKPEKKNVTFSDIMDDIPADSEMWSEMLGLKEKQERDIAAGKNFRMQVFNADSTKLATITKGYARVRSTDPKISHPTNPDLLRQITVSEHAKAMQWPPNVVAGLAKTIAHELMGQGVLRTPFVAAAQLVGESILDFAHEGDFGVRELVQVIQDNIEDRASMVVSEIRAPMAGIRYEGRVTVNDVGMVIQDIGNGVGILHKSSALSDVALGEALIIQYPSISAVPHIKHLDRPAPAVTPELVAAQQLDAEETAAAVSRERQEEQLSMFPAAEEVVRPRPSFGPRM
jgi:DNA (cytosine-5)-methyltransferase 1